MDISLSIVHTLAALFLIFVIIIQGGNSGGVGAAFGGGNSTGLFGASGATSFLGKVTYGMAAIFMISSITLSVRTGTSGKTGLTKRLEQQAGDVKTDSTKPVEAAKPAETKPETK
ncbi:MAG: preprotein translocase subunit SecG [Chitinophagaceae bacterium]|nr:preprotein translocase subunit SecG [Oligoflexus sp.]